MESSTAAQGLAPEAPEAPEATPGEPPASPELAEPAETSGTPAPSDTWGTVARSLTLAALVGLSLVYVAEFVFRADYLTEFLVDNKLAMPRRMLLIYGGIGGLTIGAISAGLLLFFARRRGQELSGVERWMWFVFPLALLVFAPLLLWHEAWSGKHERLLETMVVVLLVVEVVLTRAFMSVPRAVSSLWQRIGSWVSTHVPGLLRKHGALMIVCLAALGYAVFMSVFSVLTHWRLGTHNFDLSINNNLWYGGLKGVFLHGTITHGSDPTKYLATHAKFGGYFFLPIYWLYPKAETLLVLQSVLLGAGAIPLFAFARRHISELAALLVALGYLCFYPMHGANFYEVHDVPMAAFFVLLMVWAADVRRWVPFWIAFFPAILMREDMPIMLAVMGAFLFASGYRPKTGLVVAAVSSVWFVILRFGLMQEAGDWWFPSMYKNLWAPDEKGFGSVIKTLVTNPLFVLSKIIVKEKLYYLLHLLVPIAFLPARRWYLWAAFIPGAIITLLITDYKPPITFSFQYVMYWVPFLFVGVVLALRALRRSPDHGVARMRGALGAFVFCSAVLTYNYGAFTMREGSVKGGYATISFKWTKKDAERYRQLQEVVRLIPKDAKVSATENVGPHVSSRLYIYAMRGGPFDAEYVLAGRNELRLGNTKKHFSSIVKKKEFGVVKRSGDFVLLKRGYKADDNAALVKDWKL
jgi:uncharacterized membrane protein